MKRILTILSLVGLVILVSCQKNEKSETVSLTAKLAISEVTSTSVTFTLTTGKIADGAYQIISMDDFTSEPTETILYRSGTVVSLEDGQNEVKVSNLLPSSIYAFYMAFRTTDGEYYGDVLYEVVETPDFTDYVTIFNVDYDSFKAHIIVPDSVKDNDNALRYFYSDVFTYNTNKYDYGYTDAENLCLNGGIYTLDDVTVSFVSSSDDDEYNLNDPIVPGQPGHFCVGEFSYGRSPYHGVNGYYIWEMDLDQWMIDNGYADESDYAAALTKSDDAEESTSLVWDESKYWTGFFYNEVFKTTEPSTFDGSLNISAVMYPTRGYIIFEPSDNVYSYTVLILDDATYNELWPYLEYNEDYMQWFVTSYSCYYYLYSVTASGTGYLSITDYLYPEPEIAYHVLAVGMGDANGTTQFFEEAVFYTTARTKEAPVVQVTALECSPTDGSVSPYEAWFNIKAPNGDLDYGYYAANYEREWTSALRSSSYSTLVASAYSFSTTEVAAINTSSGYNVCVSSRPNATTIFAVLGYNDEDLPNDLDADDSPAIASYTTPQEELGDQLDSPLFESLVGEWTMSLTCYGYTDTYSWPITISNSIECTEELTEADYEVYASYGFSKEETDAKYELLKEECAVYSALEAGRNHLTVTGWGGVEEMEYQSPYDLFVSTTYSGATEWAVVYDFGPKWSIEVTGENTIAIPVNTTRFYPASSWETLYGTYQAQYLLGRDPTSTSVISGLIYEEDVYTTLYFPATISEDGNTITISPITESGTTYYLSMCKYYSSGGYFTYPYGKTNSDIVLTRNTSSSAVKASAKTASTVNESSEKTYAPDFNPLTGVKSRTPLRVKETQKEIGTVKVADHDALQRAKESVRYKRD